jgi:ATP-dependent RNA helicase MRH4
MATDFSYAREGEGSAEFEVMQGRRARPVDLLVGTPNKVLEMARGRGWDWEERAREKMVREAQPGRDVNYQDRKQPFWTAQPEMGLAGIEWVVVDEADVLFGISAFSCD